MNQVYRILRKPYAKKPLEGEGAYRFGGRWSSPGTRIAYTAEHLSLAMLEYFIHIDPSDPPRDLMVVTIEIPEEISRTSINPSHLPRTWRQNPPPPELTNFGDRFTQDRRHAILMVPSAVAPTEANWLINPQHPEFPAIRVNSIEDFEYDSRFFQ